MAAGDTSRPAAPKNFPKPRESLTGLCSDDRKIKFNLPQVVHQVVVVVVVVGGEEYSPSCL